MMHRPESWELAGGCQGKGGGEAGGGFGEGGRRGQGGGGRRGVRTSKVRVWWVWGFTGLWSTIL